MINLISSLNRAEKKQFEQILIAQSGKKGSAVLQLFKAFDTQKLDSFKLSCNANSYHVYQKRLRDKLLKFIANKTINEESTEEISPLKLLIASRKLLLMGLSQEGIKTLRKAEKEAIAINHYGLLNEIYQTEIQYAENKEEEAILNLHQKLLENNQQFLTQEKLNLAYSLVKNSLKKDSEANNQLQIDSIFHAAIDHFNLEKESVLNFKQIYQLIEVINLKAIQNKNFEQTSLFFLDQLNRVKNSSLDNIDAAPYHIKTLLALANIQFRKKEFSKSLQLLEDLTIQLNKYKKLNVLFRYEYTILLSLNLNFIGKAIEAAEVIDRYLENKLDDSLPNFNLILVRCMIYFQQKDPKSALGLLSKINETDHWIKKQVGFEWLLNKKYLEILLHIEQENMEFVESRINSLLKAHRAYFVKNESFQIIPFLKLVKQYIKNPFVLKSSNFSTRLENTIIRKPDQGEDLFFICFYAWLKAKVEEKDLYQTTLSLLAN